MRQDAARSLELHLGEGGVEGGNGGNQDRLQPDRRRADAVATGVSGELGCDRRLALAGLAQDAARALDHDGAEPGRPDAGRGRVRTRSVMDLERGMATKDEPDAEMRAVALAGWRSGKSQRQIAIDLFGAARVDAEWSLDSQLRAKVRRLVSRARATAGDGPDAAGAGTP